MATHPQITSLPREGQFLTSQLPQPRQYALPRMWHLRPDIFRMTEEDSGPATELIKKEWALAVDNRAPIVLLEKTPGNIARTRWLQRHFQPAYFISITRNGYAVAEGMRRKSGPPGASNGWPIELCARQWKRSIEVLEEDAPFIRRLFHVRYEDLADSPGRILAGIFEFLGLASDLQINSSQAWKIHEREQPVMNLNRESCARLSAQDIALIEQEAGELLARFGYRRPETGNP